MAAINFLDSSGDCLVKGEIMRIDLVSVNQKYKNVLTDLINTSKRMESEQARYFLEACTNFLEHICETNKSLNLKSLITGFRSMQKTKFCIKQLLEDQDLKTIEEAEVLIDNLIVDFISPSAVIVMPKIKGDH
tara:strand:- start:67 stop:465 length:399 start_codon:yes stop_codon:yes gene_type:complete